MNEIMIYVSLVICGLCLGSFACASVWRLRIRQLAQDKIDGEDYNENEYIKLHKIFNKKISKDRSKCLSCGYNLEWFDMIPIVSWVLLRGKCRKCRAKIGWLEPSVEIAMALFFVLSFVFWPYSLNSFFGISRFIIWLIAGVVAAIMFVYDKKWFLLPDLTNFTLILLGAINSVLIIIFSANRASALFEIAISVFILSGLYLLIYFISKGKWIGFGDIKLGLGLALLLADWKMAFFALFSANLIGCIVVIPAMVKGVLKKDSHVPFGPLLIAGALLAGLFGDYIMNIFFYTLI